MSLSKDLPKDHELITGLLVPKVDGKQFDGGFVHDCDIYLAAPDKLVAQYMPAPSSGDGNDRAWYFFCPVSYLNKKRPGGRRSRTVAAEGTNPRWHAEGGPQMVKGSTVAEAYLQKFSYMVGEKIRQGWCLVEYGISHKRPRGNLVLCKLYRSPRTPLSESEASATSTEAVWATVGEHTVAAPINDVIKSIENLVMSDDPAPGPDDDSAVLERMRNLRELL